jgi:hypothetical protein
MCEYFFEVDRSFAEGQVIDTGGETILEMGSDEAMSVLA